MLTYKNLSRTDIGCSNLETTLTSSGFKSPKPICNSNESKLMEILPYKSVAIGAENVKYENFGNRRVEYNDTVNNIM
ncbi:15471_t:CDS:2 [Funneliformis mosseae]|uniref:15471_t:CDS:1 n=1 Tax=Funneliformis mosseae TaxID=27381 RepID=A0A9N9F9N5_FUNMO|nr:15471_t:CDS:2 [Funneliformis mosseae]